MARLDGAALLPLAESIADGSPIDWDAAEASANVEEQAIIRQLRILENLAGLHRSLPADPADQTKSDPATMGRRASASPAIGSWAHLALVERLGGGSFGEVYRAWDRHLEREVALKLLRGTDASIDDPQASRITMEGRLLARVRHENVITVHGVAVHEQRVGLWMELVRGATLEQQLQKHGPFSAREAALVGIDLCRALAAIHAAGLIHRDVKAQNVMREEGGRIVLMDLGTGREIDRTGRRSLSDLAGTPLYLAPEILGGATASERSDLYSLGVLLYHLVTGSFPVRATTIDQLREAHAQETGVRLRDARADLPTAFVQVVDRAIANDPNRRYASAGALETDLVSALDGAAASHASLPAPAVAPTAVPRVGWRRPVAIAGLVAATLALVVLGWSRRPAPFAPGSIRSIAVLPVTNLTGDASQEYFADGMTEELIGALGQLGLGQLRVISRTSVMQFKDSKQPVPEIAKTLHVDAVIESSLRLLIERTADGRPGTKRVRIHSRLIYAGTDTEVWDKTFERIVADVFDLQSEFAKAVADGIHLELTKGQQGMVATSSGGVLQGVSGRSRTVNPQSYEAYLRGRYLWNKRDPEHLRSALDEFKKAVDLDPTSALAWSGLADGYSMLANYDDQPPRQVKPLARSAAQRALELDDSLAEAHAALAEFEWNYNWDFAAAQKEFDRAMTLNPNYASAHQWRGLYLNWAGRFDEASEELKRAEALDPLAPIIQINVARCHFYARRYDEAAALVEQLAQRQADFWAVHALLGQIYLAQNRLPDAIRELLRARELSPSTMRNLGVLGDVYARAGRRADAQKLLGELTALASTRYVPPVYSAMIHMGLGDKPQALNLLEQAYADRSDWILQLGVEPEFDPLRDEPRFKDIVSRAKSTPPQGRPQ